MKAVWQGVTLAESDDTVVVEGNHYFPMDSIACDFFVASDHQTSCFWKGQASYYSLQVGDLVNRDAAWYYPNPKSEAAMVKDRIAFWRGVEVTE